MANRQKIFDLLGYLHGTGVVAVGAAATAWDTGGGYTEAMLVLDITACSISASQDVFDLAFQVSTTSTFTVFMTSFVIPLGTFSAGLAQRLRPNFSSLGSWPTTALLPLRITQPVSNDFAGTVYRWLRMYTACTASVNTGIDYYATLSQHH